jgi:DNA-binding GntR family transcriptional regulator
LDILNHVDALGDEPTSQTCEQLVRLDEQFHRWLVLESGNRNLAIIVGRLLDLLFQGRAFNIAQDYKRIRANLLLLRDAVQDGDLRRVRQVMIDHMTDTGSLTIEPIGFEDVSL